MNSPNSATNEASAASGPPWKSRRRLIDASGLALFHLGVIGLVVASDHSLLPLAPLIALVVLALDAIYFVSPPKRKPILDDEPGPDKPVPAARARSFALEILVLLVPPTILILWFLSVIWAHRTLTRPETIVTLAIMPVVVGLESWIIYLRMTRTHKGIRSNATQFVALTMLATWIGSTFLFFLLVACFFFKYTQS